MLNPKLKPLYREYTITQACKLFPESRAHAFTLNSDPSCIYFAIGGHTPLRVMGASSQVKVLRLDKDTGGLVVTNLTVMVLDIIEPMTMKEYHKSVMESYNTLKLKYEITKDKETKGKIKTYHYHGFKNNRRRS